MSDKSNKNDADFQNLQDFKKEMNYLAFIEMARDDLLKTHTQEEYRLHLSMDFKSYWFMGKLPLDGMGMLTEDYF